MSNVGGDGWGIDVEGLDEAERTAARIATFLLDLRPFWPLVVPIWIRAEGRQFDSEGSYGGAKWAPLSAKYALWKSRVFPGRPILAADGDLRRAVTTPTRVATPNELELTVEPYVHGPSRAKGWEGRRISPVWFQTGTDKMPARPLIFDLPRDVERELDQVADDYVDRLLGTL